MFILNAAQDPVLGRENCSTVRRCLRPFGQIVRTFKTGWEIARKPWLPNLTYLDPVAALSIQRPKADMPTDLPALDSKGGWI
jgi:hypothetical protein